MKQSNLNKINIFEEKLCDFSKNYMNPTCDKHKNCDNCFIRTVTFYIKYRKTEKELNKIYYKKLQDFY